MYVSGGKMNDNNRGGMDRRLFIKSGLAGLALCSVPSVSGYGSNDSIGTGTPETVLIKDFVRKETLFAGIRRPIKKREELIPRIEKLKRVCGGKISGPLTHIFRFDTPVDGYDSEIGFPVSQAVHGDGIATHRLRNMHFYTASYEGPMKEMGKTSRELYRYMNKTGLSPELEMVEVYHQYDLQKFDRVKVDLMAAFLPWPEVYREQLVRVLGTEKGKMIWKGGEKMNPHILVDPRCKWVGESIDRLVKSSTVDQQFDILSRVALVRPSEDVNEYKRIYDKSKDINDIFKIQHDRLSKTRTGGFLDPPSFDGQILHVSKVPYNKKGYVAAKSHREKRKAFCFCNLVREADDPQINPVFCYRAAGWARQFWEPILGVQFKKCDITHSILKGDDFCAWNYHMP